jgi:ribose transport system ATP-binding protein
MTPDNAEQPILTLSHIVKRFGGNVAVNDVSLQVMPGEVLPCWAKMAPANRR